MTENVNNGVEKSLKDLLSREDNIECISSKPKNFNSRMKSGNEIKNIIIMPNSGRKIEPKVGEKDNISVPQTYRESILI